MKKFATICILLILPMLVFAAPKKKVTMSDLKKQIVMLVSENKALKAEIETLKRSNTASLTELNYCKANPRTIEYRTSQAQPTIVEQFTGSTSRESLQNRRLDFYASPITDRVEVDGVETTTSVKFQVTNTVPSDIISVSGVDVLSMETTESSRLFELALNVSKFDLTINGTVYTPEIIIKDEVEKDRNADKRIFVSPNLTSVEI